MRASAILLLLLTLCCTPPPAVGGSPDRTAYASLLSAVRRGDAPSVEAALAAPRTSPLPLDRLIGGSTPLLEALRVRFEAVEASNLGGRDAHLRGALRRSRAVLAALLAGGASAGASCPLTDALVFRDLEAARLLLRAGSASELEHCMTSALYGPDSLLHIAARSHASGFARLLFRACAAAGSDDTAALLTHLRLRAPGGGGGGEVGGGSGGGDGAAGADGGASLHRLCGADTRGLAVHKRDVDALSGSAELDALLAAADARNVPLRGAPALLEARNAAGLTPLLVACRSGRAATARALVAIGADADAVATQAPNFTCAHLAALHGFEDDAFGGSGKGGDARDAFGRSAADVSLRARFGGTATAALGAGGAAMLGSDGGAAPLARFDAAAHAASGWAPVPAALLAAVPLAVDGHADIKVVELADVLARNESLQRDVLSLSAPYAVRAPPAPLWRGGAGTAADAAVVTHAALLDAWGNITVSHGAIPYARTYGKGAQTSTLRAFVEAHMGEAGAAAAAAAAGREARAAPPQYVFDAAVMSRHEALFAPLIARIDAALPGRTHRMRQFTAGPPSSGSMLHFHGEAVNLLLVGAKLWLFTPPACAAFISTEAGRWFTELYATQRGSLDGGVGGKSAESPSSSATARLLECHADLGIPLLRYVQVPGDLVVVPESWGHAVLNLADAVAVALEG